MEMSFFGPIRISFRNRLARFCGWLGDALIEAQRRLDLCPDCGRSRFYGAPCKVVRRTLRGAALDELDAHVVDPIYKSLGPPLGQHMTHDEWKMYLDAEDEGMDAAWANLQWRV